ncbi:MAG: efflux RND transporter permease subunit [Verrucomicrobia bacterium]|nr:efflux RND transporter permease subunit [Verrucomicrobiota bacterium]
MNFSELFIRRPIMTLLLTISVTVFGIQVFRQLPVNDLPAVDYPVIQVQVSYPGASPETMANTVATPLEKQFLQIPGLQLATSNNQTGQSTLVLQFGLDKSLGDAATDVQAAISRATGFLPTDLPQPPSFQKTNPNDQPIFYLALVSDTLTEGALYDYGNTQLGQQIAIINGVSQVNVYGAKRAIRIKVDVNKLSSLNLTMTDVTNAVGQSTAYQGAGQFDGKYQTFLLRPNGQLSTAVQYAEVIIARPNGQPVYLKDVARVVESVDDERISRNFWARSYGEAPTEVVLAVSRQAGANAVEVARKVRELLPAFEAQLPGSVKLIPLYDRSKTIVANAEEVERTLMIAFALVVIVIFVFLGRATDTLIPSVALPLSLLITFIVMGALNFSLNNLTLMALTLAIGFLVDDAIVFLENTVRLIEGGEKPMDAAIHSARQITFTIIAMTVSLAVVFLPLVMVTGIIGRIFREFSVTIIVAIFASGLVSITLTPMMCSRILGQRSHENKTWMERHVGGLFRRIAEGYGRTLYFFLHHRWISAVTWVACLGLTVWLFGLLPKTFIPPGDSSFIRGVGIAVEGISPNRIKQIQRQVDAILRKNDAVDETFTLCGFSKGLPSNQMLILAFLKDPGKRPPINAVAADLMRDLRQIPGILPLLRPDPVLQISTGATKNNQGQYAYAISGVNADQVYAAAQQLVAKCREFPGFQNVSSDYFANTPTLGIDVNFLQAQSYGLNNADIERLLKNAYSQNYTYLIKTPIDQYQVIVEAADRERAEPSNLNQLYYKPGSSQVTIPNETVVSPSPYVGMLSVNHINQFPAVTLFFNLKPGASTGAATEFIQRAGAEILPPTVRGQLQGEAQTFSETFSQLSVLLLVAVFIMYVILGILYESWFHPITVLSSLPVATVGGLLTLLLFHSELSLYSYIGLFMLIGIVKKNGIIMVDFAIEQRRAGKTAVEAVHEASVERFRPIIMTTLAALMGAVPIAVGMGADASSRQPLGLVLVGGLIVSQFITLYVTPALYLYLEGVQERLNALYDRLRHAGARSPVTRQPQQA